VGESNNGCQINGIPRPTFLDFSEATRLPCLALSPPSSASLLVFLRFVFRVRSPTWRYWNETAELPINNWLLNYYRTFRSPRVSRPYNRRRRLVAVRVGSAIAPKRRCFAFRRTRIYRQHGTRAENVAPRLAAEGCFTRGCGTLVLSVLRVTERHWSLCGRSLDRAGKADARAGRFGARPSPFPSERTKNNAFTTANTAIKARHDVKRVHAPPYTLPLLIGNINRAVSKAARSARAPVNLLINLHGRKTERIEC